MNGLNWRRALQFTNLVDAIARLHVQDQIHHIQQLNVGRSEISFLISNPMKDNAHSAVIFSENMAYNRAVSIPRVV